jgi:hypothetical protein
VNAVLVTINRGDFIALAARGRAHPGVILLPSVPTQVLRARFAAVLHAAEPLLGTTTSLFVEIDAKGTITSFEVP